MMEEYFKVTTQKDSLVLRSTCEIKSDGSNKIASMPKGTVVTRNLILQPQDGWLAVNYQGKSGFAYAQYLSACKADGTLVNPGKDESNNGGKKTTDNTTNNDIVTTTDEQTPKELIIGIAALALGSLAILFL